MSYEDRPEYITCIRSMSKRGETLCGYTLPFNFKFMDREHADATVASGGRLVPCKDCLSVSDGYTEKVMTKPIPISAGKLIADKYDYDQVVIIARKTGEGGCEHVTTYGKDDVHCGIAARVGNFIKYEVMYWDKATVTEHD